MKQDNHADYSPGASKTLDFVVRAQIILFGLMSRPRRNTTDIASTHLSSTNTKIREAKLLAFCRVFTII